MLGRPAQTGFNGKRPDMRAHRNVDTDPEGWVEWKKEGDMAFTSLEVKAASDAITEAATQEDLFKLGLIYSTDLEDRGVDFVEAHKWFSLAAMMGSAPAKAYREELGYEMSSEELTLSQRAARGWLKENRKLLAA